MISTVIFDLDGVLCRYDVPARLKVLSEITGRTPDDIHRDVWGSGFEHDADIGRYPNADEYLAAFATHLKFPISRAQWVDARRRSMTFLDSMLEIVAQLKATHQIAILTNNVPLLRETLPDIAPRLPALFGEHIYFSCDFGVGKPDPALYLKVAELLDASPVECLFTDDKLENVEGARRAGMQGIHFTGEMAFRAELAKAGIAT